MAVTQGRGETGSDHPIRPRFLINLPGTVTHRDPRGRVGGDSTAKNEWQKSCSDSESRGSHGDLELDVT